MAKKNEKQAVENIEAVTKTEAFFEKYKKHILYGICAIVVIAAAIICYVQFIKNPREQKANEALASCEELFLSETYDKALDGDGQGCLGFLKVADEYGSTKAGNLAKLYAGLCYAQLEKFEDAAKWLEDFDQQDDAMISPAALGALGNVYANLGQNDKAIKTLLQAAKTADNGSLSPIYLIQAGELYEAEGNPEEALKLYNEVKTKYVNSMAVQQQEIDRYIERVSK
ncbi:MAG: tetratricopeptide repeat protein [Bacteroidales bacterium]|nr:tetratricopeptide repeat protein [Bacteroidales bacterium]